MWRNDSGQRCFFIVLILIGVLASPASAPALQQTADFKGDPTRGPSPLIVLFASSVDGDIYSHEWDFGDGNRSTSPNPRHTYMRGGTYTVRHTVTSAGGTQTEIKEKMVKVAEFRYAVYGLLLGAFPEICSSETTHDFGQIRPGSRAEWSFTLNNHSAKTFQITGVSGLPKNGFHLMAPPSVPLNLGAYESLEILVGFEPETSGYSGATLTIHTNAPLSPRIVFSLSGKVLNYHVNDLGIADVVFSSAIAINNSGEVVGHSRSPTSGLRSFVWDPIMELYDISKDLPGNSFAKDLNNAGQVVGGVSGRGFIWARNEGGRLLAARPDAKSVCHGINDLGQVVGITKSLEDGLHYGIFLCNTHSTPLVLDELLPPQMTPIDTVKIGNSGMVVGTKRVGDAYEAFVWEAGRGMQSLGTLGGNYSAAANLNDLGSVIGTSTFHGDEVLKQGFLWNQSEGMKPVIKARENISSYPAAINNRNEIVGYLTRRAGRGETAFVYMDGITYYLSLAVGEDSGWTSIDRAYDINDHGQIVGFGTFMNQKRAFLMTPAPVTDLQQPQKREGEAPAVDGPKPMKHPLLR